uniref:chitobiase/beta-hexosaminidase C-terminal domain-containing protein n=1 Tax=Eubacterium cellulosolvens TaxID=29322 RepID=UPI000481AC49|nr:chitobiase/beta-hexosaminidase C-terminal domain-containing protein [[Eubacterium] cellulosolvens]
MRKCTRCGADFPDDELICPVCGEQVQLVPDYVTIETHYQEHELKLKEEEKARQAEREKQEAIERRKRQIQRNVILTVSLTLIGVIVLVWVLVGINHSRKNNSYDYQYQCAVEAFGREDYRAALDYANRALTLKKGDRDVRVLIAKIYDADGNSGKAADVLSALIDDFPKDEECYQLLIGIWKKDGKITDIQKLLRKCPSDEILKRYADYLPEEPEISPGGGAFDSEQSVTIRTDSANAEIYYTMDGSTPTENSMKYTGPFAVKEGGTVVKAVVVTGVGAKSEIVKAEFNITLPTPPEPQIVPKSGTYTHMKGDADKQADLSRYFDKDGKPKNSVSQDVESSSSSDKDDEKHVNLITVIVPDGYTCYYSFDKKPTKASPKYTKPVRMRKGEHVFYAVLAGPNGKLGNPASVTLIYNEIAPTETPAPEQTASDVLNPSQDGYGSSSEGDDEDEHSSSSSSDSGTDSGGKDSSGKDSSGDESGSERSSESKD